MTSKDIANNLGRALVCAVFLSGGVDRVRERGWVRNIALYGGLLSLAFLTSEEASRRPFKFQSRVTAEGPRPGYLDEAQQAGWST